MSRQPRNPLLQAAIPVLVAVAVLGLMTATRTRVRSAPAAPVVCGPPLWPDGHAQLVLGERFGALLAPDAQLWVWGLPHWPPVFGVVPSITPHALRPGQRWKRLAAGTHHLLLIREDGTLWGLGANFYGQLGLPPGPSSNLVQLSTETNWLEITAGARASLALKNDGSLWSWGNNHCGLLGSDLPASETVLPIRPVLPDQRWQAIALGSFSAWAIHSNGTLWCWGTLPDTILSRPNPFFTHWTWQAIAAQGASFAGFQGNRLLAQHTTSLLVAPLSQASANPPPLTEIPPPHATGSLVVGDNALVIRHPDGTWWGRGQNPLGALGLGDSRPRMKFTRLPWPAETLALGLNSSSTYAFLADGALWHSGVTLGAPPQPRKTGFAAGFVRTLKILAGLVMGRNLLGPIPTHTLEPTRIWTWSPTETAPANP